MRTRITFDKITRTFRKAVPCGKCGRTVTRQKTFLQTLNPFNVHELTKLPKDRQQIVRELNEEGELWKLAPVNCSTCTTQEESKQ